MLVVKKVYSGPVGTCRYNPPVLDCTWPVVLETHWCGMFEDSPTASVTSTADECGTCLYFNDDEILGHHPPP